ncbi:hypothetical protein Ancab_039341 [Ancistrocladus abbreviatus]
MVVYKGNLESIMHIKRKIVQFVETSGLEPNLAKYCIVFWSGGVEQRIKGLITIELHIPESCFPLKHQSVPIASTQITVARCRVEDLAYNIAKLLTIWAFNLTPSSTLPEVMACFLHGYAVLVPSFPCL